MRHSMQGQFATKVYDNGGLNIFAMSKRPKVATDDLLATQFTPAVAKHLKMVATVAELSQSEIGRSVKVDPSTVNKWFAGDRLPSVYQMVLFCEAYGCSLDFIYRGSMNGVRRDLAVLLAATFPDLVLGPRAKEGAEAT